MLLGQDKVKKHKMHRNSEEKEALCAVALATGGIQHVFEKTVCLKRKAVIGAVNILYW